MNRRSFLKDLLVAGAALSILPGAVTYTRSWKPMAKSGLWVLNPDWVNAQYELVFLWDGLKNPAGYVVHKDSFSFVTPEKWKRVCSDGVPYFTRDICPVVRYHDPDDFYVHGKPPIPPYIPQPQP